MALRALQNKKGVSLIEMMVALTVLLLVALAMMQIALVGISTNRRNSLRDEGTSLAARYLNNIRSSSIDNRTALIDAHLTTSVPVDFISNTVSYDVTQNIKDNVGTQWDLAQVKVEWAWRGEIFNTTLSTLVKTNQE